MQGRFTVPLARATPRACVVCERPLDRTLSLTPRTDAPSRSTELYPLCLGPGCRELFDLTTGTTDAEFGRRLRARAKAWRDRRGWLAVRARLLETRAPVEAQENAAAFAAIGPREDLGPGPVLHLALPTGPARARPLSRRRRRAYAAVLDQVIADALAEDDPTAHTPGLPGPSVRPTPGGEAATNAAASALPGRLCGACGGGCCIAGGDRAFLSAATIRRVLAAHPGLGAAELRAMYLGHLAERTMPNSCVNHTRHGCALPRSLRADICNSFACDPLRSLLNALEDDRPVRKVVALRRRQNHWDQENPLAPHDIVDAAVLTDTKTTRLRKRKPEAAP
jgi:hypothetical protein